MKYRVTKKEVNNGYAKIIRVGYCDLQNLLNCESPIAYTSGVNGWNADIYDFGSVAIVTGYNPFGNVKPDYETCRKYDKKAEKILYRKHNGKEKEDLKQLIKEFIKEATR